jgi:hypothetical protein
VILARPRQTRERCECVPGQRRGEEDCERDVLVERDRLLLVDVVSGGQPGRSEQGERHPAQPRPMREKQKQTARCQEEDDASHVQHVGEEL